MKRDQSLPFRLLLGWIGIIAGAILGWLFADVLWSAMHPQLGLTAYGNPQSPGLDYWAMKILCSVVGAVLGLALARWRDLPAD